MAMIIASPAPERGHLRLLARQAVMQAANMVIPGRCAVFVGNSEPELDEVMGDPIIRGLMARDGVAEEKLRALIEQVRARIR